MLWEENNIKNCSWGHSRVGKEKILEDRGRYKNKGRFKKQRNRNESGTVEVNSGIKDVPIIKKPWNEWNDISVYYILLIILSNQIFDTWRHPKWIYFWKLWNGNIICETLLQIE